MKAMASDFDGTLYFMFKEEHYRPEDIRAIHAFQEQGGLFGICTGRSLQGILDVFDPVRFDFYIIASGAYVLDRDLHVLSKTCIPYELMKEIYDRYQADLKIIIHANDTVYCLQERRPLQIFVEDMEEMRQADLYGLSFATGSQEEAGRIAAEVNALYGHTVTAYANVRNVDIVSGDCSKGKALEIVRKAYGITSLAGIGDSYNDIPMLQAADVACTFPYAPQAVQDMADYVVESVAQALTHV